MFVLGMCVTVGMSRDSIAFAHVLLYISFPGLTASIIPLHTEYTYFHLIWPFTDRDRPTVIMCNSYSFQF